MSNICDFVSKVLNYIKGREYEKKNHLYIYWMKNVNEKWMNSIWSDIKMNEWMLKIKRTFNAFVFGVLNVSKGKFRVKFGK